MPDHLLSILLILAATHWVGCIAAFGSALLSMPLLVWVMDLQAALYCVVVLGILQSLQVIRETWREVDWRRFGEMISIAGVGFPVGFWAVDSLPRGLLVGALGVIAAGSGVSRLCARRDAAPWPRWALRLLLLSGGVIHGAFSSGGSTLAVYAQHSFADKQTFRGTLSAFWLVLGFGLLGGILWRRPPTEAAQLTAICGIPVVMLATWSANHLTRGLSRERFGRFVAWLLLFAGGTALARAFN